MGIGARDAIGVVTNYHLSDPANVWYTTSEIDEVILFTDKQGDRQVLNDWIIFANTTDLLVQLVFTENTRTEEVMSTSDTIFIEKGANWGNGKIKVDGIKILGSAGQQIRYVGNFY